VDGGTAGDQESPATGETPDRSERERSSRSVAPPAATPMACRFRLGRTFLCLEGAGHSDFEEKGRGEACAFQAQAAGRDITKKARFRSGGPAQRSLAVGRRPGPRRLMRHSRMPSASPRLCVKNEWAGFASSRLCVFALRNPGRVGGICVNLRDLRASCLGRAGFVSLCLRVCGVGGLDEGLPDGVACNNSHENICVNLRDLRAFCLGWSCGLCVFALSCRP